MSGHKVASVLAAVEEAAARLWAYIAPSPGKVTVRCGDIEIRLESPDPPPAALSPAAPSLTAPEIPASLLAMNGNAALKAAPQAGASSGPAAAAPPVPTAHVRQVCAPLVGIFYRAPAPDEPPYVEIGDSVTVGQQVGIIEAMKMMVPVESDIAGRVTDILVGNAEPVEFGCPLLAVADA